jgi:hypothetical protein
MFHAWLLETNSVRGSVRDRTKSVNKRRKTFIFIKPYRLAASAGGI